MAFRDLMLRAALAIPRLRRFHEYATRVSAELAQTRDALVVERDQAKALVDENESLKLQVYVLSSDFQRSVVQVEKLRTEATATDKGLQELTRELEATRSRIAESTRELESTRPRIRELETQLGGSLALRTDLEQSHARLLGRLSLVAADLIDLRRAMRANTRGDVPQTVELRRNYLDLLEATLTGRLYEDPSIAPWSNQRYDPDVRTIGRDWPSLAQTMIGTARMRNIRTLAEQLFEDEIKGDFLEAGVWRGGACIYMRGVLAAYADLGRRVFVADSFEGLPKPTPELYPADLNDPHHTFKELVVSLEEVKENFARYGLLDDQVVFLKGWFKDTLPNAPVQKLALLRLDGDMYSSTTETLEALYSRVVPGGFVIIDDYILPACRQAVEDFRGRCHISEAIEEIDGAGVFWRKLN